MMVGLSFAGALIHKSFLVALSSMSCSKASKSSFFCCVDPRLKRSRDCTLEGFQIVFDSSRCIKNGIAKTRNRGGRPELCREDLCRPATGQIAKDPGHLALQENKLADYLEPFHNLEMGRIREDARAPNHI